MFGTIRKKNWYVINGLRYSNIFRYFSDRQIILHQKPNEFVVTVISRLDGKVLGEIKKDKNAIEDFDLKKSLEVIHTNLVEGKIYSEKGEFVN